MTRSKVLLVEDEEGIAKAVRFNLEKRGFDVVHVTDGLRALEEAAAQEFDLVLLDVMLPGRMGTEVCSELRKRGDRTPVLMLTALSDVKNRVHGLEVGADDYLGKPFSVDELLARCQALLRRKTWTQQERPVRAATYRDVELEPTALTLKRGRKKVKITLLEAKLIQYLFQNAGRSFTRAELLEAIWGLQGDTQTRTLDNYVVRLRDHFEKLGLSEELLTSIRGVGYRLEPDSDLKK